MLGNMPMTEHDPMFDLFEKQDFPLSHVFLKQGMPGDGSIYFIWKGLVEFVHRDMPHFYNSSAVPDTGLQRLGTATVGGMFASVPANMLEPFTVVATSSTCEILRISRQKQKNLPDRLVDYLKDIFEQSTAWRLSRVVSACRPLPKLVPTETTADAQNGQKSALTRATLASTRRPWIGVKPALEKKVPKTSSAPVLPPLDASKLAPSPAQTFMTHWGSTSTYELKGGSIKPPQPQKLPSVAR